MNNIALFKIGYGLYLLTVKDSGKDNGCIVNTVLQVTSTSPIAGVITVNKQNHTHDMLLKSKKFNISILTIDTPFELFKHFGFQSGKTVDKFADYKNVARSKNGIIYLSKYTNAYLSFDVKDTIDFGSHTMFKADITDGEVIGSAESITYAYYQQNVKPKPQTQTNQKTAYQCNICSYVHNDEVLPEDFICPICKHGASDFTKINK